MTVVVPGADPVFLVERKDYESCLSYVTIPHAGTARQRRDPVARATNSPSAPRGSVTGASHVRGANLKAGATKPVKKRKEPTMRQSPRAAPSSAKKTRLSSAS